jgi:transposase
MTMNELRWFVGIDWASRSHRACLVDSQGTRVQERDVSHDGEALNAFCAWLLETTQASPCEVAIAIETPRGPLVELLLERGFEVFSLNPKQLDRFRDRFTVAGAKDDSRDAHVLGDSLRTDRRAFRRLSVDDPRVIELREWGRMHEEFMQERTRLTNRMRDQLWRYYPQAAELAEDVADNWFLDLWELVPTPAKAARTREKAVARILNSHRIRRLDAAEALTVLRKTPLTVAPGAVEAATAHIRSLIARLRLINQQVRQADQQIDQLIEAIEVGAETASGQICEQHDVAILRSCPGLGRINIAALLSEAAQPLRGRDYHVLRALSGVAPVTRRSGQSRITLRRHACNNRLRTALYHWARVAAQRDPLSKRQYKQLRSRGHNHARALRGVGDRLLWLLCRLLERQTLYDPTQREISALKAA